MPFRLTSIRLIEIGLGKFLHRGGLAGDAGIVEGDVDPAETLDGTLVQIFDRIFLAHVDFEKLRFDLRARTDLVDHLRALGRADPGDEHVGTCMREGERGRAAYAGRAADQKRVLA